MDETKETEDTTIKIITSMVDNLVKQKVEVMNREEFDFKEKYKILYKWIKSTTPKSLEQEADSCQIFCEFVYLVRCALVHSKLDEKELIIIMPLPLSASKSLQNIIDDMVEIVHIIIFKN